MLTAPHEQLCKTGKCRYCSCYFSRPYLKHHENLCAVKYSHQSVGDQQCKGWLESDQLQEHVFQQTGPDFSDGVKNGPLFSQSSVIDAETMVISPVTFDIMSPGIKIDQDEASCTDRYLPEAITETIDSNSIPGQCRSLYTMNTQDASEVGMNAAKESEIKTGSEAPLSDENMQRIEDTPDVGSLLYSGNIIVIKPQTEAEIFEQTPDGYQYVTGMES